MGLLRNMIGGSNESKLKKIRKIADEVEALEKEFAPLSDEQLKAKTQEYKQRYENGETLDTIFCPKFLHR